MSNSGAIVQDQAPGSHAYKVGDEFDVEVGSIAHGGHCVARVGELVVFVRHGAPGERVRVRVTEVHKRFLRGDAVAVHVGSPHRVPSACPVGGPGGCGGCDFLHLDIGYQRSLKTEVLREALERHGGLQTDHIDHLIGGGVVPLEPATQWRSRMTYQVHHTASGQSTLGMFAHRSSRTVDVSPCVIADVVGHRSAAETLADDPEAERIVMAVGIEGPVVEAVSARDSGRVVNEVEHSLTVDGRILRFSTRLDGFWQSHPRLAQELVDTCLLWGQPAPGEVWWDLYSGVGPIAAALAIRMGPTGQVVAVEGSKAAHRFAQRMASDLSRGEDSSPIETVCSDVRRWVVRRGSAEDRAQPPDGVVLDPPRSGAGGDVLRQVTDLHPRIVIVVACDPVALGRDTALLSELGYHPTSLRAWDAFPQTHHFETVAAFRPRDQIS